MTDLKPLKRLFLCYLIVLMVPVIIYLGIFRGVPSMTPAGARDFLTGADNPSVLIDVRRPSDFRQAHVAGAVNRPLKDILSLSAGDKFFLQYAGHTLFFICEAGFDSALAVKGIRTLSDQQVFNIKGGMQKWPEGAAGRSGSYFSLVSNDGPARPFPVAVASMPAQISACAAAFVIKPLYMLLSLALILYLRKAAAVSGRALKWAMIFFLAGETFCAVNYLFFGEDSYLVEYLHMAGMVAAFGFFVFAVMEFMDRRLMNLSEKKNKCTAVEVCGSCYKYNDVSCRFTRVFAFVCMALLVCGIMPLLADMNFNSYNTDVFGTIYNYAHPVIFQYFEIRFAPIAAILFFALSFLVYRKNGFTPAATGVVLFSAGAGLLGFSFFRMFLFSVYARRLWWYIIWEEITELLFIVGLCLLLWVFRRRQAKAGKTG